jgi:hypothetical protein
LTCHEVFWPYGHTTASVVLDSTDGKAVVAGGCVTIAVNLIDVSVIWIYGSVVHSAKKSIHGAELGSWLRTIGIGHDDPTGHPAQGPGGSAIRRAVQYVVDVFRTFSSWRDIPLEKPVDETVPWVDGKPVTWVDATRGGPGLIINGEVRWVDTRMLQASPTQLSPLVKSS